jgi:type II restriction/modification system DNA methylase subunit YeeA
MAVGSPSSNRSLLDFIHRWQGSRLTERSAAQSHFIDLCDVLGQPRPADVDQEGAFYTFEKGVAKTGGGQGFADVWLRGHFAWEYKKQHANLDAAYRQLLNYQEDLENPPLLVVSDSARFEVHARFTNTVTKVYAFSLADLADPLAVPGASLSALDVLRALFTDPEQLRPKQTTAQVTEVAAREFAQLASSLNRAGVEPEPAAHYLMRLLFCLFAQDIQLLPPGLFTRLVTSTRDRPADFAPRVRGLFGAMASGGFFGADDIAHFNGGLFADDRAFDLTRDDLAVLARCCRLNWASVEPAIFGTLFERSLDPAKRAQLGAHYTSREDILLIVEPVLMAPLRREWATVQQQAAAIVARRDAATGVVRARQHDVLRRLLVGFSTKLSGVRVLDPACGSGNFLYVALKALMDLEWEVIRFAGNGGLTTWFPQVTPEQLFGIEVNPYAHELAQVVVWIGYLQWLHDHGFTTISGTILRRLDNIKEMDAILAHDEQGNPIEPEWPEADIITGNPPFLGGKRLRTVLGDAYVDRLFTLYKNRVPREADLVTYWFERARQRIADGQAQRAGLLATNSIRGGANRLVLQRLKESGDLFMAWDDRPWILDGAAVRVSMVGFDNGSDQARTLNDLPTTAINADLTGALDLTTASRLPENLNLAFMGDTKGGAFDIPGDLAAKMLAAPLNPNGRPNQDVVRPWVNGLDLTRRPRGMWIIDFGVHMPEEDAALYELPFAHVLRNVKPDRLKNNRAGYRERWWIHMEPRPALRSALSPLRRCIATPRVAKHRLFVWIAHPTLPDSATIAFARADDYFFGVLHSKVHELWALALCTWLGVGNDPRYTPSTTFETFPFPWQPCQEPPDDPRVEAIAQAAQELVRKRDAWLNPPGAAEEELKRRTLTNLYNHRPTWLDLAHRTLDHAVLDAYGWPHDLTGEQILERLLALNIERSRVDQGM